MPRTKLVVSRKPGEDILIGDNADEDGIVVRVVGVHGDKVRIAVQADAAVPVNRRELAERKEAERKNMGAVAAA